MIDRETGRLLLSRVSKDRWDSQRIKEAGEIGGGGWSCDHDRHLLIWLGNNATVLVDATMPNLLSEIEKLRLKRVALKKLSESVASENIQLRAEIEDLISWGASDAKKELVADNERLQKEISRLHGWET